MNPNRDHHSNARPAVLLNAIHRVYSPRGHVLSPAEAAELFGDANDQSAAYSVSDDGMARRHVSENEARENSLGWIFDGRECRHGHLAPRKRRPNDDKRGNECMACRAGAKRRARLRKKAA